MDAANYNLFWDENFPPLYNHTSIAFLKRCPGFYDAKKGNMRAALFVAGISVKTARINELRKKYPAAVLLPVIGKNKLPEALARIIGLKIYRGISKTHTLTRKKLTAMERLLHKPQFRGKILKGENYIIVDDIVTQGGTVSALRRFVLSKGGFVVAVAALAHSAGSGVIAPDLNNIHRLIEKFEYTCMIKILRSHRIADTIWEMTNSQIKYLSKFKTPERLVKKIITSRASLRLYHS
jgi:phosphoribosylpyrophosphate synthetase